MNASLPLDERFSITDSTSSNSPSGTFSGFGTSLIITPSARDNESSSSDCNKLRRLVFDLGSKIAQIFESGYLCFNAPIVAAIAVG